MWHALSKTLAEKTTWALPMDRGVNMVSIIGGLLMVYLLLWTSSSLWTLTSAICIFENVQPYGRYLCFNLVISCNKDAIKLAHILLPPSEAKASPLERFALVLVISICIGFGHLRFSILVQRLIFS